MESSSMPPFHLAFPVTDLAATRQFYVAVLGAREARRSERWIDFDFWGHQISAHLVDQQGGESATGERPACATNLVDGEQVPARHFGAVLPWAEWHALRDRLLEAEISFLIQPQIRFEGRIGEQATMFFLDPSGHALEFKSFRDPDQLFAV
jgi:extradiol dioxygenase family protein